MRLSGRSDFDYGNTRLRARRGDLLRDADYERLLGSDIDHLLGALAETPYAAVGEPTRTHHDGLQRLHRVIRAHLGRTLEEMRSFYSGRARELVDVVLARFDIANIVAVLRARSSPDTPTENALTALAPVGWLTEPLAREILRPHEMAGVVELLTQATPDRDQAGALRTAFSEYERTEDLPALERAVVAEHAARVAVALSTAGSDGAALSRFARREVDERNLVVALRLRDALAFGAEDTPAPEDILRPGGSIPPASLVAAARAPAPAAVVAALGWLGGGRWHPALARWAASGDLHALQRALERGAIADAAALFATGDPLAIDVPFAFTTVKQVEARNLRLLGEAAVRGITPDSVRGELVWTETRP